MFSVCVYPKVSEQADRQQFGYDENDRPSRRFLGAREVRVLTEAEFGRFGRLAEATEDFRALADAMPQLVWTARSDGTIDYFNRRWVEYTGTVLEEIGGRDRALGVVHPDDLRETWARWEVAVASAAPYEMEYRLRGAADGSYRWFLARATPLCDERGQVVRWIGTATDIDDQHRSRDALQFLVEAGQLFSSSLDAGAVCEALARVTVAGFADWCFVTRREGGRFETVAIAHRDPSLVRYVEKFRDRYPMRPQDAIARVITDNEPLIVERISPEQIEAGARDQEHLALLRLLKMRSLMSVPLTAPSGNVFGAVTMVSAESGHRFDRRELEIARTVARHTAIGIESAHVLAEERSTSRRLRFMARIDEVLFATTDFSTALERIARAVAEEICDACVVGRIEGETLRTVVAAHRDPAADAIVAGLRDKRTLRPDAERDLIGQMREHRTYVRTGSVESLNALAWPFLWPQLEPLAGHAAIIVPLHSGRQTYGALAAYYTKRTFDRATDGPLLEEIAARVSVAVERVETMERERRIASTLQRASLPTIIPRPAGLLFDAVYAPAGEEALVGGDWYDAIELDDGSVVVSVGDVTGRGIEAAAIMSKVRHAMGIVPRHESDPRKILDSAEWFLRKRYPDAIVTAFVGILSPDRRTFRYANAGHPLRRGDELTALHAGGLPLGIRHLSNTAATASVDLREGDLLLLYTDGLVEWDRDWVRGQEYLERILRSDAIVTTTAPAALVKRACLPSEPHDDVAILSVALRAEPDWSFGTDDARAAADARANFVAFLRGETGDSDLVDRAELVFGELLGNVVRHAQGPVEIVVYLRPEGPELHVIDTGDPFRAERGLPSDVFSDFGRGLYIVRQLARDVFIEHIPNCGNHVTVTL